MAKSHLLCQITRFSTSLLIASLLSQNGISPLNSPLGGHYEDFQRYYAFLDLVQRQKAVVLDKTKLIKIVVG